MTPPRATDPFRFLDQKLEAYRRELTETRQALKELGWILRPCHPLTGMWRARRWTERNGTERLFATTSVELILLAGEEKARRPRRRKRKPLDLSEVTR